MQLINIPECLRMMPQWCVADPITKAPRNPTTGKYASPTDPTTWGTFREAVANPNFPCVGFMITKYADLTVIDIDDKIEKPLTVEQRARCNEILASFKDKTYIERSTSGRGFHILLHGTLPMDGVNVSEYGGIHRNGIEMYSDARFMVCTGDMGSNSCTNLPISRDYQQEINELAVEFRKVKNGNFNVGTNFDYVDSEQILSDDDIWSMAKTAINGAKFQTLCKGDWGNYQSRSEADYALLSILAYYSKNNEQVKRMFRLTGLARKKSDRDDYLDRSLRGIRASEPVVDISAIVGDVALQQVAVDIQDLEVSDLQSVSKNPILPPPAPKNTTPIEFPAGLLGDAANYILASSARPVPEIALAAAIALLSGICQRQYNVSGTGLNQYIILIAKTGRGKEAARTGINTHFRAVRDRGQVPSVDQFKGPAAYSSGPAVLKSLIKNPCIVSVLGEFGMTLAQMCDSRANAAMHTMMRVLLDLYGQSGKNGELGESKYSTTERDSPSVHAPCLTILGETTPETFYGSIGEAEIASGLIPRFLIIESKGDRLYDSGNAGFAPSDDLVNDLANLAANVLRMQRNDSFCDVRMSKDVVIASKNLDIETTDLINSSDGVELELHNRHHLQVLKLSALSAVSRDFNDPEISMEDFEWARKIVARSIDNIMSRAKINALGGGEGKQMAELERVVSDYFSKEYDGEGLRENELTCYNVAIVPKSYLQRKLSAMACFRNDRLGATSALNRCIGVMVESGRLSEISPYHDLRKAKLIGRLVCYGFGGN